jgi:hypothetical protein
MKHTIAIFIVALLSGCAMLRDPTCPNGCSIPAARLAWPNTTVSNGTDTYVIKPTTTRSSKR